jgi:hypothetical protein
MSAAPMPDTPAGGEERQVLHPSKYHSIAMSLASLVCCAFLFKVWIDGIEYAWVAGGFLAASSIYYASHVLPGNFMMSLDKDGFTITEFYNPKRYQWLNVSDIVMRKGIIGPSVEFYDLTNGGMLRVKMNQTYGYRPRALAQLMVEWRNKSPEIAKAERKNIWRT